MERIMKNMTSSGVGDERNGVYRESQQSDFAVLLFSFSIRNTFMGGGKLKSLQEGCFIRA